MLKTRQIVRLFEVTFANLSKRQFEFHNKFSTGLLYRTQQHPGKYYLFKRVSLFSTNPNGSTESNNLNMPARSFSSYEQERAERIRKFLEDVAESDELIPHNIFAAFEEEQPSESIEPFVPPKMEQADLNAHTSREKRMRKMDKNLLLFYEGVLESTDEYIPHNIRAGFEGEDDFPEEDDKGTEQELRFVDQLKEKINTLLDSISEDKEASIYIHSSK